jgi:hypothetical protein
MGLLIKGWYVPRYGTVGARISLMYFKDYVSDELHGLFMTFSKARMRDEG